MTNFIIDIFSLVCDTFIMADKDNETEAGEKTSSIDTEVICKYCLQTIKELRGAALLSPCQCTNPVCQICLKKRLKTFSKKRNVCCEICRTPFDEDIISNLFECRQILTRRILTRQILTRRVHSDQSDSDRSDSDQTDDEQSDDDQTDDRDSVCSIV